MRFEKSQDPVNTVRGLARAVDLLRQVSPGIRFVGGLADAAREPRQPAPIELPLEWLDRKIGRHVDPAEVRAILTALQFGVEEPRPGVLSVAVPTWRATKDIAIKDDLVEEVGRMIGYASIPPAPPLLPASVPPRNHTRAYHHLIRDLVTAQGFDEVYNYSFVNEEALRRFGLDPDAHVRVLNPIAADQTHLRKTLLPGIRKNIVDNMRFLDEFRLFEIGVEIHKRDSDLPDEVTHLCAAAYRKTGDAEALFELKRLAECIDPAVEVRPAAPQAWEHPARAAELVLRGETVGRLFEMHPSFVERGRAAVLDIDLDATMRLRKQDLRYQPVPRFPSSAFDLSVVVPAQALVGDIRRQIAGFAETDAVEYVRQYSGPPLPDGTKSVSYRITVSAPDRTLSSDEVSTVRQRVITGMRGLGHDLRV
jgi:phenylalanyl-tRNA synthetase beta chain